MSRVLKDCGWSKSEQPRQIFGYNVKTSNSGSNCRALNFIDDKRLIKKVSQRTNHYKILPKAKIEDVNPTSRKSYTFILLRN